MCIFWTTRCILLHMDLQKITAKINVDYTEKIVNTDQSMPSHHQTSSLEYYPILPWSAASVVLYEHKTTHKCTIFTTRCYASAVLATGLCPSVTSRCSAKTAKRRITQTAPHDSPGTLVFLCQRSPRNSTRVTPYEGAECRWGGSKSATFD